MFSPVFLPAHDPLAGILSLGNAAQLSALAGYFLAQARLLQNAADDLKRKERAAIAARDRRQKAKADWIKLGCRAHVLRTRGLEWPAIAARCMASHDVVRAACGEWRKQKQARARARRDADIFALVCANVKSSKIAERYGISARQVRAIAEAARAHLALRR